MGVAQQPPPIAGPAMVLGAYWSCLIFAHWCFLSHSFTHDWHAHVDEEQELGTTVMGVWQAVPPSSPSPPHPCHLPLVRSRRSCSLPTGMWMCIMEMDGGWLCHAVEQTDSSLNACLPAFISLADRTPPRPPTHYWKRAQAQYSIQAPVWSYTPPKLHYYVIVCYFHAKKKTIALFPPMLSEWAPTQHASPSPNLLFLLPFTPSMPTKYVGLWTKVWDYSQQQLNYLLFLLALSGGVSVQ